MIRTNYEIELEEFVTRYSSYGETKASLEFKFESLCDWSQFGSIKDIDSWYEQQLRTNLMHSTVIPLLECKGWSLDKNGALVHESGGFFRVDGCRVFGTVDREVATGWDQPVLTQVGYDGGILGLVRQRFNGVPHYLVEAKAEPGNYNIVQISTTVQATFSNLQRMHKGSQTPYSNIFLEPEKHPVKILWEQWTSEDGGRLFNKRNRSMLVEYAQNETLALCAERFRWVSLYQLKWLIQNRVAIVAPHIRGILSSL